MVWIIITFQKHGKGQPWNIIMTMINDARKNMEREEMIFIPTRPIKRPWVYFGYDMRTCGQFLGNVHNEGSDIKNIFCDHVGLLWRTWIYLTEYLIRSSLFFGFWKRNFFFLPSPYFKFMRTMFYSLLSTLYIWNTSTSCSRSFQAFYKVYYFVDRG